MQSVLLAQSFMLWDKLRYLAFYVSKTASGAVLHDYVVIISCLNDVEHGDDIFMF